MFTRATKKKLKARIALDGPAGSGKTFTALRFAFALAGPGERVAVIDTEHRSASKYQGEQPDGVTWDFDVCELENYEPSTLAEVVKEAGRHGYGVVVIDSLSHFWEGKGGALEQVDKKSAKGGNSFTAWKDVTPMHRNMVEAILACPAHIICTMRSKMEYVLEEQTNSQGKKVMAPKKIGMAPIQRQGVEYEFDVVCDIDVDHTLTVSKTRCPAIDGQKVVKPGALFVQPLAEWLGQGVEVIPADQQVMAVISEARVEQDPPVKKGGVRLNGQKTASQFSSGQSDPCGEVVADQIKAAAKAVGLPPEKLIEVLKRCGVSKVADLSCKDATELLHKLEAKVLETTTPF